jgi:plastocyanin
MHRTASAGRPSVAHLALAPLLAAVLALTGCGEDAGSEEASSTPSQTHSESHSESPSETASPKSSPTEEAGQTIEVTFEGDQVTPNGERVEVRAGEEITFVVEADAPGSLHVHSTPEAELAYETGRTRLPLTVDQPGVVEVESHELGVVVVQLEVR